MMSSTHWHVMFTLWWASLTGMWCLLYDEQHSLACDVYFMMSRTHWHVMFMIKSPQHSMACDACFMTINAWHCTWEVYAYFQTGHSVNDYIPSLFMFFDLLVTWILLTASAVILSLLILEGWFRLADIEKCVKLLELSNSTSLFDFFIFIGVCCTEGTKVKFF